MAGITEEQGEKIINLLKKIEATLEDIRSEKLYDVVRELVAIKEKSIY